MRQLTAAETIPRSQLLSAIIAAQGSVGSPATTSSLGCERIGVTYVRVPAPSVRIALAGVVRARSNPGVRSMPGFSPFLYGCIGCICWR